MTDLEIRLHLVQERIAAAARRAGRDPAEVRLVAVTKTLPVERIAAAYDLGVRDFGENRIEEAAGKVAVLPQEIVWHMIGRIQSRKAKAVVRLMHWVHSVDSVRLAARLDRLAAQRAAPLPVLLEINISGEPTKAGFPAACWLTNRAERQALVSAIAEIVTLPHLQVEGLMTIAPIVPEAEQARPAFASLRRLRGALREKFPALSWPHLSMGMTDDFEVAVDEGATIVRVGRAIFAGGPAPATGQGADGQGGIR